MLTFLFRPRYPGLHWRPKNTHDLLNRTLVRVWQATEDDCKVLEALENAKGKE